MSNELRMIELPGTGMMSYPSYTRPPILLTYASHRLGINPQAHVVKDAEAP